MSFLSNISYWYFYLYRRSLFINGCGLWVEEKETSENSRPRYILNFEEDKVAEMVDRSGDQIDNRETVFVREKVVCFNWDDADFLNLDIYCVSDSLN